jgi:DNA-binding NarL/FixJ family response regulator
LCTGYSHAVTPEMATREGIRDYLMKPVSVAELHQAVQKALTPS